MRKTLMTLAVALTLTVAGCGSDQPAKSAESAGSETIEVTIAGDAVTPNGDRLKLGLGQKLTLHVTSDREGELHVHSTPEQELEYAEGETTLELEFDKPGIVDVEDHDASIVIVQLEVS